VTEHRAPSLSARRGDASREALETLARSVHELFPRCARCGQPLDTRADGDVLVFEQRMVHARGCVSPASTRS
jgi:hypothetical protein